MFIIAGRKISTATLALQYIQDLQSVGVIVQQTSIQWDKAYLSGSPIIPASLIIDSFVSKEYGYSDLIPIYNDVGNLTHYAEIK